MKGTIHYELIILYDRFRLKPKDIIRMGYKKSTAYNYSRITKNAQEIVEKKMMKEVVKNV